MLVWRKFDYSGTQACRAIREEGIKVVLVNSNPATIQTDLDTADVVYIEPLVPRVVERIIEKEKPDGVIATMAGQTGLNLAVELREVLAKHRVRVLGPSIETVEMAEDREKFRDEMLRIGEPIPASQRAHSVEEALEIARELRYPLIVRPDYCLGGTGSGIADNEYELREVVERGIAASATKSVLVEQSVAGLAEIEYEVIRDGQDNCITICSMENVDPMGVHTGESIVVAPCQTLSDDDHQMLRAAAIKIIRALGVRGACNIQFALNQQTGEYYVIEVNPRASRSSALASKATGYPIARVATKIALGYSLPEIENEVTGKTACFEPALDYVVLKIPRWPFDKLRLHEKLGTGMKSTGETMAIGRTFEEALQKAVRSLELRSGYEQQASALHSLEPSELRLFKLKELLAHGKTVAELARDTRINPWFLEKLRNIAVMEKKLARKTDLTREDFVEAKRMGFSDVQLASLTGRSLEAVRATRRKLGVKPVYKMVDTCAGEYPALTPYFYSSYESEDESSELRQKYEKRKAKKIIILGSGPIRMGQGIEFDYCTVHAVEALRGLGYETVVVNNNPETVSTDFDVSDKLYFEPLTLEDVLAVVETEQEICRRENTALEGVIVQFGGQTAINLALPLHENGVRILGTSVHSIDVTEDRKKFQKLARTIGIPLVESGVAYSRDEAMAIAEYVGYPVLIRPSYVLGGRAMEVVANEEELRERIDEALQVSQGHPIAIDHFIQDGIEIDVDVVGDGRNYCIAGVMEQVEEAGIHSGDSACSLPSRRLSVKALERIREYAIKLCSALKICGVANIQMACKGDDVTVLEVNPRASRTVPFVSKATGVYVAKIAAVAQAAGESILEMRLGEELKPLMPAVKAPVFPFNRFPALDPRLGAEMRSTGETMGVGRSFEEAYLKSLLAAGMQPGSNVVIADCGKWAKAIADKFRQAGVEVSACSNDEATARIAAGKAGLLVSGVGERNGRQARLEAVHKGVPCITSAFAAIALAESIAKVGRGKELMPVISLNELEELKARS